MSLSVAGTGIILFFISLSFSPGAGVPILNGGGEIVDPLPHTFMLTFIVINLATTALGLALILRLYQDYDTLDLGDIFRGDEG